MIPSVIIIRLGSSAAPQCINQWDFSVSLLPHTLTPHLNLIQIDLFGAVIAEGFQRMFISINIIVNVNQQDIIYFMKMC